MANHARAVVLKAADRAALERILRSPSERSGLARRARVILLLAKNTAGAEVSRVTGYSPVQVSRIRARFCEEGIAGLEDRARSGRPPAVTARDAAKVVALTLKKPPAGLSQWSTREMAERVGLSHMTVTRIWHAHALTPHRLQTFKFTKDPRAEEKITDVIGLYMNPPNNAIVLCVDEKTQIQALSRTQPLLPVRPGLPARQTHDYRRNGLTSLYAALNVASGAVTGTCTERHTAVEFLQFLKRLARKYTRRELHVVLDNSSTHSTPEVKAWLEAHPRITFHFTPTGASWLNMVEAWFGILTRKSVRRGSFNTVKALVRHIQAYIEHWNECPTPFVWTREPADVIRKALRRS